MSDQKLEFEPTVGASVSRVDGPAKLTGRARYVDDYPPLEGELAGRTVRSSVPRGLLRAIRLDPGFDWSDVTVVTAEDVPDNVVALIEDDQPVLARDRVNHVYGPVALVACRDRGKLERACRAIEVDVEPLPAVLDPLEAMRGERVVWGEDNVQKRYRIRRGRADAADPVAGIRRALAECSVVVRGRYSTHHHDQLYVEPQGVLAYWNEAGVHVLGSMQCPYYVQKGFLRTFRLSPDQVHVTQAVTGGGFGGKEEYPTLLALHAALLARKSGRPVRMIYDRTEDLEATTKRHPSVTEVVSGCDRDGRLRALHLTTVFDAGAYVTLTPVVLSRGVLHAGGPYRWDDVLIEGVSVATNTPPNGAYRGFGVPQTMWAIERHLDRIARELRRDPVELKAQNLLAVGDCLPTGQRLRDSVGVSECVDRALRASEYRLKRRLGPRREGRRSRGIGASVFIHGAGFTGSGEQRLKGKVAVDLRSGGRLQVRSASTDIGQGTTTVFSQIAADAAGLPLDRIEVAVPCTTHVPDSGPTVASRTVMVVGSIVEQATRIVAARVRREQDAAGGSFAEAGDRLLAREGEVGSLVQYSHPDWVHWNEETYQGDAYPAYAWACDVAEVEVDLDTLEVEVVGFWTAADVGKAIHPVQCKGQLEGGALQGIGWALNEEVVWEDGRIVNPRMTNYIVPTALDAPPFETILVEQPYPGGPGGGAKGIGELPMDGAAPAIAAAVENATGLAADHLPLTPERLLQLVEEAKGATT
ncbi:MAG: xanthine dehydrogenase family protein [Deltaproteobacteria bacterium]|jgi:CO/xanthine dehydrogenase Mo-binding subunit|nr:xanthine dehydrogenase family protein [Deltaproteobacteria bacterium]MBW2530824.1 xanthine dehydrogenase family protein [Deltaproteobacteria bacterium]